MISKELIEMAISAFLVVLLPINAFLFSMNAYYSNQVYDHDKYFSAKSGYNINLLPISPFYGSFEDVIRVKILSEGKSSRAVQSKFPSTNSNITQQNRIPYG